MYESIQRGEYLIGDREMYFRSKWEANYALYLNFLVKQKAIKGWMYEPQMFEFPVKHGTTRYMPDFKIENNDGTFEFHEVKGYMDSKSKTKLKRMAKYHPKVKVVLIDGEFMKSLNKYKKLLKFY